MRQSDQFPGYGGWGVAIAALFAALTLLAGCTGATSSVRRASGPDVRTVDSLFAAYAGSESPGASVVVIHEGRAVLTRAYGLAELEERTPATSQTHYRLASLSKQFTAMAIMQLAEEGKLRYDAPVASVLPGFPAHASEVRIRHLLNHTSGIWDYEAFVPETQTVQVKDRDVLELLSRADRTHFPPGSEVRYSNSGYAVLALIVEQVSGVPFARFLRERVFTPVGMRSTVAHEEGLSMVPHRAYGYAVGMNGFRPRDQSPTSAVLGDGGIYSSVDELVAWDRALDAHVLVGEATQRLAWMAPALPDGTSARYGFGWFVDDDGGRLRLSHHGETSGFTNAVVKYPEQRLTVIVLTNRAGGEPWRLAQRLADLWLGTPGAPSWPFETFPAAR
ncbi:serine hydrolase domain-containing protein [Stigmatella aurantiaca]|uniref:Beta-lactamase n=1 Tax=Stigmatella aurantiaca (strain DW4/3-1) TaxID=378806 RepID=Q09DS0_STIAD|nr:serine hydrolase domain-containing protein [Stigmatella aurantiaca]ADO75246.1 Beta-lactamase [Stigmatella aurantiaca DW4/3-1]EAU69968.1 beta-lactamase [Stigmatella aurantiaca DW4/3-1]